MDNGNYQLSLIKELSFVRYGGTEEELAAANILLREIRSAGGEAELMEFNVPSYDLHQCSVTATAPFTKDVECVPYGRSGDIDAELRFLYADRGAEEDYGDLQDLSGCVVLINQISYEAYDLLVKKHASAFITISGKWWGDEGCEDLVPRTQRPHYLFLGKVPGFIIRAKDALELVQRNVERLHVTLRQTEKENVSRNVLAVIPGASRPWESIMITAHYDSVTVGTGSWDNASGAANVMAVYRHFLQHPPKRTLRFLWCGSEEQGLLGSKAYIAAHEELVKKEVKFCFNFDMCGTALGSGLVFVTGGEDLMHLAGQYCKEVGYSAELKQMVHSSDSAPFADKGVPCLGLTRRTTTAEIHTRHDLIGCLSPKQLQRMEDLSVGFIGRVANAAAMPVPLGMPENIQKELDKYFFRDKMEATKKAREEAAKAAEASV